MGGFFADVAARADGDLRELADGGFGHAGYDAEKFGKTIESDDLISGRMAVNDGERLSVQLRLGAGDGLQNKIGDEDGSKRLRQR